MKPTPRTDAESWAHPTDGAEVVDANFARDLERQLSDALEREKALRDDIEKLKDPVCVIVNTLRGSIAKLTMEQYAHICGEDEVGKFVARCIQKPFQSDEPTYTDCPMHGRHEGDCPRC